MNLTVQRNIITSQSTLGELMVDGVHQCWTLEPAPDRPDHPSIAAGGPFPVVMLWSVKFNRVMPHVLNVPNRSAIEIHWGNKSEDTEGCTIVGKSYMADYVLESKAAWLQLMDVLNEAIARQDSIFITYLDPEGV